MTIYAPDAYGVTIRVDSGSQIEEYGTATGYLFTRSDTLVKLSSTFSVGGVNIMEYADEERASSGIGGTTTFGPYSYFEHIGSKEFFIPKGDELTISAILKTSSESHTDSWGYAEFTNTFRVTQVIPEPVTILLLASGLIGLVGVKRKFKN